MFTQKPIIAGVAAHASEKSHVSVGLIRFAFIFSFFVLGLGFFVYLWLWMRQPTINNQPNLI